MFNRRMGTRKPYNLYLPRFLSFIPPAINVRHVLVGSPPHRPPRRSHIHSASSNQYLPPHQQYYPPSAINSPVHIMPPRPDLGQRKRPKYTRSKTGCLTCRVKKIKVRLRASPSSQCSYFPSATRPSQTACAAPMAPERCFSFLEPHPLLLMHPA